MDNEQAYIDGQKALAQRLLSELRPYLSASEQRLVNWNAERADAVRELRRICKDHGDNNWPDDLHLGDVIEKHLGRYLAQ